MSLYPTYDRRIMEAIRQLTLEEMLTVLHDVALLLMDDRMRDLGLSRELGMEESLPMRPALVSFESIVHAMQSAGFPQPGFQTREDLEAAVGVDTAAEMHDSRTVVLEHLHKIGEIMEQHNVNMGTASIMKALNITQEDLDEAKAESESKGRHPAAPKEEIPNVPPTIEGFGWDADG